MKKLSELLAEAIPILFGSPKSEVFTSEEIRNAFAMKFPRFEFIELLEDKHEIVVHWVPKVSIYEKDLSKTEDLTNE